MSIINPDGIGSWLWVASQGKVKDRQTVWQIRSIVVIKLLNTFTFFDYHCTSNHYLSSSTQASKSPLFATATRESANFEGELTSENPFSIQSKSLSPHVSSTFSSIACLYRRACFSKAIFHLGQVTCRSGFQRGISITRNKRISVHFEYIFMTPWCEQQRKWTQWNFSDNEDSLLMCCCNTPGWFSR